MPSFRSMMCLCWILPALASRPATCVAGATPAYDAVEVTIPRAEIPAGGWIAALGLDNAGRVVVGVFDRGPGRWYLWQHGTRTEIALLLGWTTQSVHIASPAGDLVGTCTQGDRWPWRAFVVEGGRARLLPDLPGFAAEPSGIAGRIVTGVATPVASAGQAYTGRAMVWVDGVPRIIGPEGRASMPQEVNERGQVLVSLLPASGSPGGSAYVWENGRESPATLLAPLPGAQYGMWTISAESVVVGACSLPPKAAEPGEPTPQMTLPALWVDGRPHPLAVPYGGTGRAYAINKQGQIVGCVSFVRAGKEQTAAALWDRSGRMQYLSRMARVPGGCLWMATAINDRGQILCKAPPVGKASLPSMGFRAFLLTPRTQTAARRNRFGIRRAKVVGLNSPLAAGKPGAGG